MSIAADFNDRNQNPSSPFFPPQDVIRGSDQLNQLEAGRAEYMGQSPQELTMDLLHNTLPNVYLQSQAIYQALHVPNTSVDTAFLDTCMGYLEAGKAFPYTNPSTDGAMFLPAPTYFLADQHMAPSIPPLAPLETLTTHARILPLDTSPSSHSGKNWVMWGIGSREAGSLNPRASSLRTAQACEKCRTRKAKCSGDRPTCQRCLTRDLVCTYAPERKMRGPNKRKPHVASTKTSRRAHRFPTDSASSPGSEQDSSVPNTFPPRSHTSPQCSTLTKRTAIFCGDEDEDPHPFRSAVHAHNNTPPAGPFNPGSAGLFPRCPSRVLSSRASEGSTATLNSLLDGPPPASDDALPVEGMEWC
ncbi:hypothetical protein FA95DRAFT_1564382 [Auriscalpium vulgare]|uniref:Uncharacterized protein n=1 Tax=Auriscalpium vulgare TaxID=40419 RepID=A0ACB8REQ4_9AGAM|nr:hypothetical protein FA95DRAFT_1564382 [Auriscalpium vulgare]